MQNEGPRNSHASQNAIWVIKTSRMSAMACLSITALIRTLRHWLCYPSSLSHILTDILLINSFPQDSHPVI